MNLTPVPLKQYHIFLASPSDVNDERKLVRQFFERYNRHTAQLWGVRFEVIDWENFATVGIGRVQELITKQTLQRFKDSLALVIGIMGQRFGSPTGKADSGTEEEFEWAFENNRQYGSPEIKWFFKRIERFEAPPDPDEIAEALKQWERVRAFRAKFENEIYSLLYDAGNFRDVFESDLSRWLADRARPWIPELSPRGITGMPTQTAPNEYYEILERDFHRLDIAGIDNDRAFEIPLSEIYVRLRVIFDEDSQTATDEIQDASAIDIQTALLRFAKLVIVGDPGSGKSTFLKYVALMIARANLTNNPGLALEKLCIEEPLPIPIFISCWDLSDFLKTKNEISLEILLEFLSQRLASAEFELSTTSLQTLLNDGNCCLLFDGLDEVPTDAGRAAVSRLLEECLKRYPKNRFVVTSRVRAYTGDTILKGGFARCDIQPFNALDRAQFLTNWVSLLFKTLPEHVAIENSDANREFSSITEGIEKNDRIRSLAVNPLLLTVIAIVHWNRKRLPEQRVDLYSECVDVLLGQRKEAEHTQLSRKIGFLDERDEENRIEERAWIRKRFGEIALHILSAQGNRDEASKADIVKLLMPRFAGRGSGENQDSAELRATIFLERQELRSGLLVSRREHTYRFVHLTFQEYLAAWHLSNQESVQAFSLIEPRLRHQRWFETLQLLGGEWAKQSDEKLDSYVQWLLSHQGNSVRERAPVVALCANIVKDTNGVTEMTPLTKRRFKKAVEATLDAFRPNSGIPALNQLEILEALGQLGASVKPHLIEATKSGLYQVRRRAIEMLLPHLSDDELFAMDHILRDRSKEPIKTFLLSLLARDAARTANWLLHIKSFGEKATEAFTEVRGDFENNLSPDVYREIVTTVFERGHSYYSSYRYSARAFLLDDLSDETATRKAVESDREVGVRIFALSAIAETLTREPSTLALIKTRTTADETAAVRINGIDLLLMHFKEDSGLWQFIHALAMNDKDWSVRLHAMQMLVKFREDDSETWSIVRRSASKVNEWYESIPALEILVKKGTLDRDILGYIRALTVEEQSEWIRKQAFSRLVLATFKDVTDWRLLTDGYSGLDVTRLVTNARVSQLSQAMKVGREEIKVKYEDIKQRIHSQFGLTLQLEWEALKTTET
ncbi:MAG TPA: NACHT domain-containing protein [Pyrinomonadaceae bacterium]|nr:NACHT domain-containing protein [Pyrinomonadaceae bacterium]